MESLSQLLDSGNILVSFKENGRLLAFVADKDTGEVLKRWGEDEEGYEHK